MTGRSDSRDEKFNLDMDYATALSLESLAFEKFRQQKLEEDKRRGILDNHNISICQASRSRPKPGSIDVGDRDNTIPLLKPPPSQSSSRRSSNVTQPPYTSTAKASEDLVSFDAPSPPPLPEQRLDTNLFDWSEEICRKFYRPSYDSSKNNTSLIRNFAFENNEIMATTCSGNGKHQQLKLTNNPVPLTSHMYQYGQCYQQQAIVRKDSLNPFKPQKTNRLALTTGRNDLFVLDSIKKKDDNNLIDLPLFKEVLLNNSENRGKENDIEQNGCIVKAKIREKITHVNGGPTTVRNSVLEAFDPLLGGGDNILGNIVVQVPTVSEKEEDEAEYFEENSNNSIYMMYDPFDYMYTSSLCSEQSDPIYAAVVKTQTPSSTTTNSPPPLPPRNNISLPVAVKKSISPMKRPKEGSVPLRRRNPISNDPDLITFHQKVITLRNKFVYSDSITNPGIIYSPRIEGTTIEHISIKVIVFVSSILNGCQEPVVFTCDVQSAVEHIILHVTCARDIPNPEAYILKVHGLTEYLLSNTHLSDYLYVRQCIKLDEDLKLNLVLQSEITKAWARTAQDDICDMEIKLEDLMPIENSSTVSYESLTIVLETLEKEMKKIDMKIIEIASNSISPGVIQTRGVHQALKAICSILGNIEPNNISKPLKDFINSCDDFSSYNSVNEDEISYARPTIIQEGNDYSVVKIEKHSLVKEEISKHCDYIRQSVYKFIETYSRTYCVDFELETPIYEFKGEKSSSEVLDPVLVQIDGIYRLCSTWNYDEYLIAAQIYHGTRPISSIKLSNYVNPTTSFYKRILFDRLLSFDGNNICLLPRESRLVFVLYGRYNNNTQNDQNNNEQVELGWTSIQFYNYNEILSQGGFILHFWPPNVPNTHYRIGPSPPLDNHVSNNTLPAMLIEFPCYSTEIKFPKLGIDVCEVEKSSYDFHSLDRNTQEQLLEIIEQDTYTTPPAESREILWEKRRYLLSRPEALPKVFLAAHSWDYACLPDLHSMLRSWTPMSPIDSLQLLLPCFPDENVRQAAVSWMADFSHDEIVDYMPQLTQALKHETFESSALTQFLLERALMSPRVAHYLYWFLVQLLPSQLGHPNVGYALDISTMDVKTKENARYYRRIQLILRVLILICGQGVRNRINSQKQLVKLMFDVVDNVKSTKESLRLTSLLQNLESVDDNLRDTITCIPSKPSLEVNGIYVSMCSYFESNTLPLKINFRTVDSHNCATIFKAGDDLQQDMLTIQMIKVMDKLWLQEGLDLKIITFACMPTGDKRGIIEMVSDAETLRRIHVGEFGVTGPFKDKVIADWLAKHNPSELEYERAVHNFTASCAGFSVATYILGICDRHNDNIMIKRSGHLFHIDFGKFLGDAQTFGNFKRDRTAFVLTPDMFYVINGGDKPTERFHHFVDLCCQAFNIVRKRGNLMLNLFGLMVSSGIPGVTIDAVQYVQKALLLNMSNAEAAASFARMIENSLKSRFTQLNFFLHNLAQLRFTEDPDDSDLLSFVPKKYTMQEEGRIESVSVYGYQKRYDPEKYYVYILEVKRERQNEPHFLLRSFKEFVELQQKLCVLFPLAKCYSLSNSTTLVGRSNIKYVAGKRKNEIEKFIDFLFSTADEISHSDLVYTFFHPLLRDQKEKNIHQEKLKECKYTPTRSNSTCLSGQLKLSIQYQRDTLIIMIYHAKDLPRMSGREEPSTYVKVYLLPDPAKITKRKTKVIKRTCHPSFMEMLEYRMPYEAIRTRTLKATVWNHDTFQENEFLGGICIPLESLDLNKEILNWYSLGNIFR